MVLMCIVWQGLAYSCRGVNAATGHQAVGLQKGAPAPTDLLLGSYSSVNLKIFLVLCFHNLASIAVKFQVIVYNIILSSAIY